jgi:hypothetical protein
LRSGKGRISPAAAVTEGRNLDWDGPRADDAHASRFCGSDQGAGARLLRGLCRRWR